MQQACRHFLPVGARCAQHVYVAFALQVFTDRDKLHFGRNNAAARVMHLRYVLT